MSKTIRCIDAPLHDIHSLLNVVVRDNDGESSDSKRDRKFNYLAQLWATNRLLPSA